MKIIEATVVKQEEDAFVRSTDLTPRDFIEELEKRRLRLNPEVWKTPENK